VKFALVIYPKSGDKTGGGTGCISLRSRRYTTNNEARKLRAGGQHDAAPDFLSDLKGFRRGSSTRAYTLADCETRAPSSEMILSFSQPAPISSAV
jgi:hypothetical protein